MVFIQKVKNRHSYDMDHIVDNDDDNDDDDHHQSSIGHDYSFTSLGIIMSQSRVE